MNPDLVTLLAWISVELDMPRPNQDEIKRALHRVQELAAKTTISLEVSRNAHRRLAQVVGDECQMGAIARGIQI
jgi:hypothetical protein